MAVPEGLTKEILTRRYLVDLLTESEIAQQFGTYQVCISRLRKRWGIPTLGKTGRLSAQLPAVLTPVQEQLLVGSLLGDGWMTAPSDRTAVFHEGHCLEQAAYTDWKTALLAEFVSCTYRGTKHDKVSGKVFHSHNLATHASTVLRSFYDLFYPAPARVRQFPKDLPARMTPLVLAVWYMDDGSVDDHGRPRIAFGLDDTSRARALRALRALGLHPKVYGEGGDQCFHFPLEGVEFRALVEPHLLPLFNYKLPRESERQRVDRNARSVFPDKVATLYRGGLTKDEIASMFQVSTSTISRRLIRAGVSARRSGPRSDDLPREAADEILAQYDPKLWPALTEKEQDRWVHEVKGTLRRISFPITPVPSREQAAATMSTVVQSKMQLEDGVIRPIRSSGIALCAAFFPGRYRAVSLRRRSAFEAWHDDRELERAVRFQFKVGDPVLPHRVLRAVTMNCRTPSVFRPTVARVIYETFCPKGGRVWDPCSGYGGRLLGALAAGVSYCGTDVDEETVEGNRRLAALLGLSADVHLSPAENFCPSHPLNLVFTSPPYFDRERYSTGANQSWKKYTNLEEWLEGFLRPVIRTSREALLPDGYLVLNIADLTGPRGVHLPLVQETTRLAQEEGFLHDRTLWLPLPKLNRENPREPVLVFSPV